MALRACFIFLSLLLAPLAQALDLGQCVELALLQDANYQAARAEARASRELVPQARAQLLPNLSASLARSKNQTDSEVPGFLGQRLSSSFEYMSATYNVALRQPLYRKFNFAQYRQAEAQQAGGEATLEKNLQDMLLRLSAAYFEALLADDQTALVRAQQLAIVGQLQAAKRSFESGMGTRTDIDDAQARYDLSVAQELEARQNQAHARRQLQTMINQPVTDLAALQPERMELLPPNPAAAEEWVARSEAANGELRALRANIDAARQELEKARAGHTPTVDLLLQRSRGLSQNDTTINQLYLTSQAGLQVNVPLFAGGYHLAAERQALANIDKASEQYEARRRDIGLQVRREFDNVAQGVFKVRALEQAQRSADQAVLSNQKGYQAGTRSQIDILNAEQQRMNARRDLAQARYQYLLARLRLQAQAGSLDVEELSRINAWLGKGGAG